jgi:F-type H+-transporting ATPase subunit epsilon
MELEIVTPLKTLYTGKVKLIQLPGAGGSFEILNNHSPIISTLTQGIVRIVESDDRVQQCEIEGGIVECKSNVTIILADSGQMVE